MRLRTPAGATLRLAYCTNVSPAEDLDGLRASLGGLWSDVRRRLAPGGPLGLGLWFPEDAAHAAAKNPEAMRSIRAALAGAGLRLETVNAFPARAFHAPVVKAKVYEPSWLEPARLAYTVSVARAVTGIVPRGSDITLSTLPLAGAKLGPDERHRAAALLLATALELHLLRELTGTTIRLALEPEPTCALETTSEAIEFFGVAILPFAASLAQTSVLSPSAAQGVALRHLGVCLDLCHAAVEHEDPVEALGRYAAAGVPVFKVQVSAALAVPDPGDPEARGRLGAFVEPRWLHQVGAPGEGGGTARVVLDLPNALADEGLAARAPWRVHFHVPLGADEVGGLPTTRADVERFLAHVATLADPPVLELETYTWSAVPGAGSDLASSVAREIEWVRGRLAAAGCRSEA